MNTRTVTLTTLAGLVFAGLGIVVPIVWDIYKGRSKLELQQLPSITLVENRGPSDEITILYRGKKIRQLTKATFVLVNSGRTAILKEHLISPPTIRFTDGSEILDAHVDDQSPPSLGVQCQIDDSRMAASLTFPLLNPGDRAIISLTVSGSASEFSPSARIVNINQLTFVNRSNESARKSVRWPAYVVAPFTLFSLILTAILFREFPSQRRIRKLVYSGKFTDDLRGAPKEKYEEAIKSQLLKAGWTSKEMAPLNAFLREVPADTPVPEPQHAEFASLVTRMLRAPSATLVAFWVFLILTIVGGWYVVSQFV
jgi:hypothetical protein